MALRGSVRNSVLVLSGHRRIYYGWWIMIAASLGTALLSGLFFWSFGLYIDPVERHFGWSRAEVSLGVSVALLAGGLVSPLVGRWTDRRGPRFMLLTGAAICAAGFGLLATTSVLWQWYLYLAVIGVSLSMIFFIAFPVLVSRWFEQRRGVAIGLLAVGISIGGIVFVPIIRLLIDALGWEGALVFSAVLVAVYFLPVGLLVVRDSPDRARSVRDGPADAVPEPRSQFAPSGVSLGVAIRTPLFWALALAIALYFYASFGLAVHAVPLFESRGISAGWAAGLISIMAGVSVITRLLLAVAADRVRRFESIAMLITGSGVAVCAVILVDASVAALALFVLFWSFSDAGPSLIEPLAVGRAFGMAHFATILGTIAMLRTGVMLVAPAVAGAVFDATGSYDWALVMLLGAFGASLALFYVAMRLPHPVFPTRAVEAAAVAGGQ